MTTLAPGKVISKLHAKMSNERAARLRSLDPFFRLHPSAFILHPFAFILPPSSLPFDHFLRVPPGLVGNLEAAEHARDFFDAL